jgi:hypothetical protein
MLKALRNWYEYKKDRTPEPPTNYGWVTEWEECCTSCGNELCSCNDPDNRWSEHDKS